MEEQETYRAGTRITYKTRTKSFDIRDVCIIYPDKTNQDYYVALSRKTSKVGIGSSIGEAYIDLIIGIVRAMKHCVSKESSTVIERESGDEHWEYIDTVHRLDEKRQSRLITEICTRLNIPEPAPERDIDLEFDELGETMHLALVSDLEDTIYNQDCFSN